MHSRPRPSTAKRLSRLKAGRTMQEVRSEEYRGVGSGVDVLQNPCLSACWVSSNPRSCQMKSPKQRSDHVRSNSWEWKRVSILRICLVEDSQPGYPHLATLKCEQSFMLYRGFSWVHARLIMDLQAKIAYLEKELDELDKSEAADLDTEMRLRWVEEDMDGHKRAAASERTRQKILEELRRLVLDYGMQY